MLEKIVKKAIATGACLTMLTGVGYAKESPINIKDILYDKEEDSKVHLTNKYQAYNEKQDKFWKKREWTKSEKALIGALVVAQTADMVTTYNNLNNGGEEFNPIYNNKAYSMNKEQIILSLVGFDIAEYFILKYSPHWVRKTLLPLQIIGHGYFAYANTNEDTYTMEDMLGKSK